MDWKDIGSIVAKAAPILSTALGGPVGLVAGAAGSLVASFLGCEESPEAVGQVLKDNPDALLKLKELEDKERERLFQWKQAQLAAEIADRDSARDRDVAITKAKGGNLRADLLALVAMVALVGVIAALFMFPVPEGSARDLLLVVTGCLINIVKEVYGFEFGSSRGEQEAKPLGR